MFLLKSYKKWVRALRGNSLKFPDGKIVEPWAYGLALAAAFVGVGLTVKNLWGPSKIEPPQPLQKEAKKIGPLQATNYNLILERNIFNLEGTLPDFSNAEPSTCGQDMVKSKLAYTITGILFSGESRTSLTLIQPNETKQDELYKQGDTLGQNTKIVAIEKNKVLLSSKNGCPEYLALDRGKRADLSQKRGLSSGKEGIAYVENGFERTGNQVSATKQWVSNILNNGLSKTLGDARAQPRMVGGQVRGFSLTEISPDSVYSKLGLQNGDVVTSINGIELNDAARAIQTLNAMRSESRLDVQVNRGGQDVNLQVNIQ